MDHDGLLRVLRYLANGAAQRVAVEGSMRYHVAGAGPYELFDDGVHLTTASTPDDVLFILYQRCYGRLLEHLRLGGWVPLHGAMATVAGRRLLVLGEKGAGKTTLMLRLLYDGHAVEGDELVFTREGVAVPMPRSFHVKAGTEALIPELAGRLDRLPATSTSDGTRIAAFDPSVAGFPWHIAAGPIDGAFVLRPDRMAATCCSPLTSTELVRFVVDHALPLTDSRSASSGRVPRCSAAWTGSSCSEVTYRARPPPWPTAARGYRYAASSIC